MSQTERRKLMSHLNALNSFPDTKTVRQLRKELRERLERIENKFVSQEKERTVLDRSHQANSSRSGKLKKYHNYLRQIRNNYPEVKYTDLRKMFKLRKQGKEVEVPDVVWQNPSP